MLDAPLGVPMLRVSLQWHDYQTKGRADRRLRQQLIEVAQGE
jgi:hypothetical protein